MKLYVGNLGDDGKISASDLRPLFEKYGDVTECEVVKKYAFVHMSNDKEAMEAISKLDGSYIKGRSIKVKKSDNGSKKASTKLFVGNLAEGTTTDDLKELFSRHTNVIEADVIKNFGFVHIDADNARIRINEVLRELNGYNLNGNKIRVQQSTSGVRHNPGMGGDTCYRCGRDGHWSKECPTYPDNGADAGSRPGTGSAPVTATTTYDSRGYNNGNRSGPMRGDAFGTARPVSGPGAVHRGDPYPRPPPPSYIRERMGNEYDYRAGANAVAARSTGTYSNPYGYNYSTGTFDGFPTSGGGQFPAAAVGRRDGYGFDMYSGDGGRREYGFDQYNGSAAAPRSADYDRRDGYSGSLGYRDAAGAATGPMRGTDPYSGARDSFFQGTSGSSSYGAPASYGAGVGGPGYQGYNGGGYGSVISTNTGSGGGTAATDAFSRRASPGTYDPMRGGGSSFSRGYPNSGGAFGYHSG